MKVEVDHTDWSFWLQWILASTMGGIVGNAVATNIATSWETAGALYGVGTGILQWLVLRRWISRAGWWVLATTLGGAVGLTATMVLVDQGIIICMCIPLVDGGLVEGAIIGILQWLVLRGQVSQSGWWLLASIVGWVIGNPVGYLIAPGCATGAAVTFAIISVITGPAMVWLLSTRE